MNTAREMTPEARAERSAYMKEYRKQHPDKFKQYNKKWRDNNKDKVKNSQAAYWNRIAAEKSTHDKKVIGGGWD